ncbi:MAG: hypothetical protein AAGA36_00335 [Pseudomonadota bacterium]
MKRIAAERFVELADQLIEEGIAFCQSKRPIHIQNMEGHLSQLRKVRDRNHCNSDCGEA